MAAIPVTKQRISQLHAGIACGKGKRATHPVLEPFSGREIHRVPLATVEDVLQAAERARRAQKLWAARPGRQRAEVLKRFHDLVFAHQNEIVDLIQLENGKARLNAWEEVGDVAVSARHYAYNGLRLLAPERRKGVVPLLTEPTLRRHPRGLVVIISPRNFPVTLPAGDSLSALLAGNAVIIKPDVQTTLALLAVIELLHEAGLPEDVIQVLPGRSSQIGEALVEQADFVQFSGSTESGKALGETCGRHLVPCSLELGGKNPLIVLDDASLGRAVEGAVRGIYGSGGQMCVHIERVYVQEGIYDRFVGALVKRIQSLRLGPGYDYAIDVGAITTAGQLEKIKSHVEDALGKGATLLAGGKERPDLGPQFYEPTLLADVTGEMLVYKEETFGPVASVYKFKSIEEVVQLANDSIYGLNASLWTRNLTRGRAMAGWIRTGTVNINDTYAPSWGSADTPMGGMKQSGLGRRHGPEGLLKYTDAQSVVVQHVHGIHPPAGTSTALYVRVLTAFLKLLRWLPGLR